MPINLVLWGFVGGKVDRLDDAAGCLFCGLQSPPFAPGQPPVSFPPPPPLPTPSNPSPRGGSVDGVWRGRRPTDRFSSAEQPAKSSKTGPLTSTSTDTLLGECRRVPDLPLALAVAISLRELPKHFPPTCTSLSFLLDILVVFRPAGLSACHPGGEEARV